MKQLPPLPSCDNRPLWDIWLSVFQLPALTVADELGIFSYLEKRPAGAAMLGEALGLSEKSSEILLDLLSALHFLTKQGGVYHLNDLSRTYLLPNSPYYWGGVLHTVREMPVSHDMIRRAITGKDAPAVSKVSSVKFTDEWQSGAYSSDRARRFTAKMHSHGFPAAVALAGSKHFKAIRSLLDAGGGSGAYSIALAATYPNICCTVAELPEVCPITREYIASYGLSSRINVVELDMFKSEWPAGSDAILLSDVLHDWDAPACEALLEKAHEALRLGGRLFIHEVLLADNGVGPLTANAYSMAMLMVTHGRQFTAPQILDFLSDAGFKDLSVDSAYGYYSLISGAKP